jgi:hypothetical protein
MQRRKLLAVAGALSMGAFATTVGLGANLGLFGLAQPDSQVGRLDGTKPTATVVPAAAAAPVPAVTSAPPVTSVSAVNGSDDADD